MSAHEILEIARRPFVCDSLSEKRQIDLLAVSEQSGSVELEPIQVCNNEVGRMLVGQRVAKSQAAKEVGCEAGSSLQTLQLIGCGGGESKTNKPYATASGGVSQKYPRRIAVLPSLPL